MDGFKSDVFRYGKIKQPYSFNDPVIQLKPDLYKMLDILF